MFWPVLPRISDKISDSWSLISFFFIGEEIISSVNSLIFISSSFNLIPVFDSIAPTTTSLANTFFPKDFLNRFRSESRFNILALVHRHG